MRTVMCIQMWIQSNVYQEKVSGQLGSISYLFSEHTAGVFDASVQNSQFPYTSGDFTLKLYII